jgi:hypothetical protein
VNHPSHHVGSLKRKMKDFLTNNIYIRRAFEKFEFQFHNFDPVQSCVAKFPTGTKYWMFWNIGEERVCEWTTKSFQLPAFHSIE